MSKLKTMIAYKYHQTGQIVILERNLRKKNSGMRSNDGSHTLNEKMEKRLSSNNLEK
jgi:hypothetical protein